MKTIYTLLFSLFFASFCNAQTYFSDFEDGTLQNWLNVDATTDGMSVQGDPGSMYLQKITDGSLSGEGLMAIVNGFNYNGDYTCDDPSGINCFGGFTVVTRNQNAFDLHIRIGFVGANGTLVASQNAAVLPANSDWTGLYLEPYFPHLAVVSGSGTVEETMADVQEIRVFHNENFSFDGDQVVGTLEIELIYVDQLLNIVEQALQLAVIYPNPASEEVNITFKEAIDTEFTVYDIFGKRMSKTSSNQANVSLPISELASGVYFLQLKSGDAVMTRKFVKQ